MPIDLASRQTSKIKRWTRLDNRIEIVTTHDRLAEGEPDHYLLTRFEQMETPEEGEARRVGGFESR